MDVRYLDGELLKLRHELHQLKITSDARERVINEQASTIKELTEKNKDLQSQLIKLQDKLNINSSNSGLPTSKEIYRLEKRTKAKSLLKAGGQPGQKPRSYEFKIADRIVEVAPEEKICKCGGELVLGNNYRAYQKIEIPPIKPIVTEYRLHDSNCNVCAKKYRSSLDNYKLLERNAETIIASLGGFFNNSKREIQAILKQIFNLNISLGLVSSSEERVSKKLEGKYNELIEQAESSQFLHLDETSANNKGKTHWCWVAASKDVTVFKLANSRGRKALEGFLAEYEGKVITDRYAVYNIYEDQNRQVCLAHLRRDFKRFAHSQYLGLSKFGQSLVGLIDLVFDTYNVFKKEQISHLYYLRRMRKLKKKMLYYLRTVSTLEDCDQARRVANNILKSFDMMWLFVESPEIEPTNNFAERQIKHFVKYRKNSFFTWSSRGERFLERIKSICATAKLHNLNSFQQIHALL